MTCVLAALALSGLDGPAVGEYFPLTPGTKWTYEITGLGLTVDIVKPPVTIEGKPAHPVVTSKDGKEFDPRYYRIEGDTVFLVAYDAEKPIPLPHPILVVNEKKSVWTYSGSVMFYKDWVPFAFRAQSTLKGKRSYFGKERTCVEVVVDAEMEGLPGQVVKYRQTTLYASGVGWVETKTRSTTDKKTTETTIRLVRFEAAS